LATALDSQYYQARAAYLKSLGVVQWYAKKRLPGAASSPELVVQNEAQRMPSASIPAQSSVSSVSVESPGAVESIKVLASSISGVESRAAASRHESDGDKSSREAGSLAENPLKEVPALPSKAETRTFAIRSFNAGSVFITSDGQALGPDTAEVDLLRNILRAIGLSNVSLSVLQTFSWPVFELPQSRFESVPAVEDMVSRWLNVNASQQGDKRGPRWHLHFGSVSGDMIESVRSRVERPDSLKVLLLPHSLEEMLAMPMKKARVWEVLCSVLDELRG